MKIGVVAPSCRLDEAVPDRLVALARSRFGDAAPDMVVHPQCYLSDGHFAGPDKARADAFLELANDPGIDAIWFARGGYGANRILPLVMPQLNRAAGHKAYLGYSDGGFLLAALDRKRIGIVAHGPMPTDIKRDGGEAAVARALDWLVTPATAAIEQAARASPSVAFNLTVLSHLIGTPWQPELAGRVLMIEEIDEYMYRIDRALFHVTSNPAVRKAAGLRLGRCSAIPDNDPDFAMSEEAVARHWCSVSGIAYLGRADIGHDAANQVVPFAR